jgi:hypothetical protein
MRNKIGALNIMHIKPENDLCIKNYLTVLLKITSKLKKLSLNDNNQRPEKYIQAVSRLSHLTNFKFQTVNKECLKASVFIALLKSLSHNSKLMHVSLQMRGNADSDFSKEHLSKLVDIMKHFKALISVSWDLALHGIKQNEYEELYKSLSCSRHLQIFQLKLGHAKYVYRADIINELAKYFLNLSKLDLKFSEVTFKQTPSKISILPIRVPLLVLELGFNYLSTRDMKINLMLSSLAGFPQIKDLNIRFQGKFIEHINDIDNSLAKSLEFMKDLQSLTLKFLLSGYYQSRDTLNLPPRIKISDIPNSISTLRNITQLVFWVSTETQYVNKLELDLSGYYEGLRAMPQLKQLELKLYGILQDIDAIDRLNNSLSELRAIERLKIKWDHRLREISWNSVVLMFKKIAQMTKLKDLSLEVQSNIEGYKEHYENMLNTVIKGFATMLNGLTTLEKCAFVLNMVKSHRPAVDLSQAANSLTRKLLKCERLQELIIVILSEKTYISKTTFWEFLHSIRLCKRLRNLYYNFELQDTADEIHQYAKKISNQGHIVNHDSRPLSPDSM